MNPNRGRLQAEWEPQSGVQLTWPHEGTDWLPYLQEAQQTFIALSKAIIQHELLLVVATDIRSVSKLLYSAIDPCWHSRLRFCECAINDTWARDHGALTLSNGDTNTLLDFRFNGWGEKFKWQRDNMISRHLAQRGLLRGTLEDDDDFVLEGGSIESDGQGTILTTRCLLADHRNQPLKQQKIEQELMRRLNADRVLWLNHGSLIGDDTDGHIDTLARFAPNDTILYIGSGTPDDAQHDELEAMEQDIRSLRTRNGEPYKLLRLPLPRPVEYEGERLPATYANFLVINGAVIYPTYGQPDMDEMAGQIIQEAYPDRQIIGIDATVIVRQHGSLHCLTMQYPEGVII